MLGNTPVGRRDLDRIVARFDRTRPAVVSVPRTPRLAV
jgi:hypothetical protein